MIRPLEPEKKFGPKLTKLDLICLKIRQKPYYFEENTKNMLFRRLVLSEKTEEFTCKHSILLQLPERENNLAPNLTKFHRIEP